MLDLRSSLVELVGRWVSSLPCPFFLLLPRLCALLPLRANFKPIKRDNPPRPMFVPHKKSRSSQPFPSAVPFPPSPASHTHLPPYPHKIGRAFGPSSSGSREWGGWRRERGGGRERWRCRRADGRECGGSGRNAYDGRTGRRLRRGTGGRCMGY